MTRRYLTPKQKDALWQRQGKCCADCGEPVPLAETDWDHITPLALYGSNDPHKNFQGLHRGCHKKKSAADIGMIRKADRQGKYHRGEKKRRHQRIQSAPFQTQLRKRMSGRVEVRT